MLQFAAVRVGLAAAPYGCFGCSAQKGALFPWPWSMYAELRVIHHIMD